MTVAVTPSAAQGPARIDREVRLLKAALLYADETTLLSPVAELLSGVQKFAGLNARQFMNQLGHLDLHHAQDWGLDVNESSWATISALLRDPAGKLAAFERRVSTLPESDRAKVLAQLEQMRTTAEVTLPAYIPAMRAQLKEQAETSGYDLLAPLLQAGRVRLAAAGGSEVTRDAFAESMTAALTRAAQDSASYLLTDEYTSGLIESMLQSGVLHVPTTSTRAARRAQVHRGFVESLQAFPDAAIDDILEIRDGLKDELSRYRTEVARLSDSLSTSPYDVSEMGVEVEDLWAHQVSPALEDIRQAMESNRRVKWMRSNPGSLVTAATAWAGVGTATLWFGFLPLPEVLGPTIAAAGTTTTVALNAAAAGRADRASSRSAGLYFLHEVDSRL